MIAAVISNAATRRRSRRLRCCVGAGGTPVGRRLRIAAAAAAALATAAAPAAARAESGGELFGGYTTLAQEERTPAPLVPLTLPAILGDGEHSLNEVLTGGKGRYRLVYKHFVGARVDALISVDYLGPGTPASRRKRLGGLVTASSTRVRGHPGLLVRARFGSERLLIWREDGRTYEVGTGTPATISVAALRAFAAGLRHLLGSYTAQTISADGGVQEAEALLVDGAVRLSFSWTAPCTLPGSEAVDRGASATTGWVALTHGAFGQAPFAVPGVAGSAAWNGSVGGDLAAAGGQITFQAASAAGAESCAIGPLTLQLARLPRLRKLP